MTKQSNIFIQGEGDSYFERNKHQLVGSVDEDIICRITTSLSAFKKDINSIFEVGCSSGLKLQKLCQYFGASGFGIDPSSLAIEAGNKVFNDTGQTEIKLHVGTADAIPAKNNEFDLVFFGFCLYLVDRQDLYKSFAEADRVLKQGGFLVILDFDSNRRMKNGCSHKEGVFSYKNDSPSFLQQGALSFG